MIHDWTQLRIKWKLMVCAQNIWNIVTSGGLGQEEGRIEKNEQAGV